MAERNREKGLSPRTANPNWRHVSVYLPPALYATIAERATQARRSVSAEIVVMLEAKVQERS